MTSALSATRSPTISSPRRTRRSCSSTTSPHSWPVSWVSLAVELQRDWARQDTVQAIVEIVLTDRLLKDQEK